MKTIVITGANRGLGFELLRYYASHGWTTFPVVRREEAAEILRDEFGEDCFPITADLSSDEAIPILRREIGSRTHRVDVLINNAGISGSGHEIEQVQTEEVRRLLDIHTLGPIRTVQAIFRSWNNPIFPKSLTSRPGWVP